MTASWHWEYPRYDPKTERLVESLCTLGNGRFATRGAAPECTADAVHYPATYLAGCYNRLTSAVAGRTVSNEDLVRLPDWTALRYRCLPDDPNGHDNPDVPDGVPHGDWLTPDHPSLRHCHVSLDLRAGTLTRRMLFHDAEGRRLGVTHTRLVHLGDPHLAAQRTVFRAYGWSGRIEVASVLDGDVANAGVERYHDLAGRHFVEHRAGVDAEGTAWLDCTTSASRVRIGLAVRTSSRPVPTVEQACTAGTATQTSVLPIRRGRPVVVVKTAALFSSLDRPLADPVRRSIEYARHAPAFATLLASHQASWQRIWSEGEVGTDGETGRILRLHAFHVLQTLSPHTAELDAGVPARGLHGEAYRGHVFWDELFVVPYLALHFPVTARALLMYRHRRLPAAREAARRAGAKGAMFPWQSGSSGAEETQRLHLNPRSGRWLPDHSHLQRHVGSAIAWNVWQYGLASGDTAFMHGPGAELLLHTAHFWADYATWDPGLGRYRIRGVLGPDEYHDAYPDAAAPGIDDNAYTNVTAAWVLARALDLYQELPAVRRAELLTHLGCESGDLEGWRDVSHRMYVPFHRDVISQFHGYGDLAELDWETYRARYHDIRRLDRILEAEGDTPNRYQASKQADTLMLGYLLRPAELAGMFARLGHALDDALWDRTVTYYLRRTCHGSTLSSLVHGWVLARQQGPDAWRYCREALLGDITDVQGGTTGEGIHLGAMAGTLDLVERGIVGLDPGTDGLHIDPVPLSEIPGSELSLSYLGHRDIRIRFRPGRLGVSVPPSLLGPVPLVLPGDRRERVAAGQERWFRLPPG
ncbi:glycoside hydrolase family 65 protein [Streptomyces bambusae]|uniref:Glycoside hydrolase family 65 protein n=1 Tax=Streptomyces bambusae TaxID=1550616 RepID=A0ABS6YZU7_9ACTN|nr:glycoside hydrolase family 65 protein [Streptomyces bambusae]MBW5480543.1 glycoside hydrolase family 65 protein [Streptomyces bambusae]